MAKTRVYVKNVGIESVEEFEGEILEDKVKRIMEINEPIEDSAPPIYTEAKDGVIPEYNVRTDRFEVAVDAMDTSLASEIAKAEEQRIAEEKAILEAAGGEGE